MTCLLKPCFLQTLGESHWKKGCLGERVMMLHLKNKSSSRTRFSWLRTAWGTSGNQWMLCFDIYPTVYLPSARISAWLVTPRSPSPAGSLSFLESWGSLWVYHGCVGYSGQTISPFCVFQEHKVYHTRALLLFFCTHVVNLLFLRAARLACLGQAWPFSNLAPN